MFCRESLRGSTNMERERERVFDEECQNMLLRKVNERERENTYSRERETERERKVHLQ